MRKAIKRVRLEQQDAPPNPDSRATLIIPLNYSRYELRPGVFEQFLLADSGEGDDERILIFGRESFVGLFTNFIFNQNNFIFP